MLTEVVMRLLRHMLVPLAVYLTQHGYLPEAAQGDFVEFIIIGLAFVVTLAWSYLREVTVRGRAVKDIINGPPD